MQRTFRTLIAVLFIFIASATPAAQGPSLLALDSTTSVTQQFEIAGFALNAPFVHIWAWLPTGPLFLGQASATGYDLKRGWPTGHFSLMVPQAPVGAYLIVVYAFNPKTHTFDSAVGGWYTVRPCVWSNVGPDTYAAPGGKVETWVFQSCR